MKKALVKRVSLLLLVTMLLAAFAGCSGGGGTTPTTTTPKADESTAAATDSDQSQNDPVSKPTDPTTVPNETEPEDPTTVPEDPTTVPEDPTTAPTDPVVEFVDYAASVKLDMTSNTAKQEVTIKQFVDGDTTHFYMSKDIDGTGVLKARYLAINTPESTGKIEEYGKAASNFTKSRLSEAVSIYIESDDENWNLDSTGGRYLVWVWYKTADMDDYRNLNIEILQEGLAIASNSANNRYGSVCMAAITQARNMKLNVHSGEKDPDFYYGDAVELDLKELRTHVEQYEGMKVAFEGVVTMDSSNTVYVENYDPDTGLYFGMTVYYGYNLSAGGLKILSVGNRVRIVGTVSSYNGAWQVSGLQYRQMKPDDPGNIKLIDDSGTPPAYTLTEAATFANGKVEFELEDGSVETYTYAQLAMSTSVSMKNLKVISIYTTTNEDSSSKGAMTLTCQAEDGTKISVRTAVLTDEQGKVITADYFQDTIINVTGIVDYYEGNYQIKVFTTSGIEFVENENEDNVKE